MDEARNQDNQHALRVLEVLKKASKDLQNKPIFTRSDSETAIKALIELDTEALRVLSTDPTLFNLSTLLCNLNTLVENLEKSQGYGLQSLLRRQLTNYKITQVAKSIETEIQAWIDRDQVKKLVETLEESVDEDEKVKALVDFETRVSQGFNRDLQDLILKAKIFSMLEFILCDSTCSKPIRERSGLVIAALVRFNKDVFVGLVLMGRTIRALISMASARSLQVLSSLIKLIKSPLVDEIESNGEIPKIMSLLMGSEDLSIQVMAMECVLEIGYFERKEAVEAMLEEGLIEKLVELQRSEHGGDLAEMEQFDENGNGGTHVETESKMEMEMEMESEERKITGNHPFASCVARFAIQLEVGEGLGQGERRAFKLEILRRLREASVSDAEAATIVAEGPLVYVVIVDRALSRFEF
ncbi:hypothetical protein L1049_014003 [Liquidambar formosana]|uniref:Uncharacterized protein n=1 Tax=Liquidambar formosana TaxID=63359 RepID=A0AAP0WZ86_LIQFO